MRRTSQLTRDRAVVSAKSCRTVVESNICGLFTSLHVKFCGSREASVRLQASGVAGSMTWKLTGDGDQTRIQLSYSVGGFVVGGFDRIAPAVERMLNEQLNRLKLFAETGKPTNEQ